MAVYCLMLFTCLDFRYVFLSWCFHLCVYGRVLEDYYYFYFFLCTKSIFNFLSLPCLVKLPCMRNLILIIAKPAEILDIWWDLNMLQTTQIFFKLGFWDLPSLPNCQRKRTILVNLTSQFCFLSEEIHRDHQRLLDPVK